MKINILIKSMSLLVAVVTIFIVILYEPKTNIDASNNLEYVDDEIIGYPITEEVAVSSQEILQDYNSDILTINLGNVIDNLTLDEKNVVRNILNKLSVIDCAKVNSILKKRGIIEALSYMEKRLIKEDYKRLEGILNQYIDLV